MKFLPLLLAAAPAVMGRACKRPHRSKTAAAPVPTSSAVIASALPVGSIVPVSEVPVASSSAAAAVSEPAPEVSSVVIVPSAAEPTTAEAAVTSAVSEAEAPSSSIAAAVATVAAKAKAKVAASASGESFSGSSTWYGGNLHGGMCSFTTYTLPSDILGTAYSGPAWDTGAHCGECIEVTGPAGETITAMIVDQCPECDKGHLDLFPDAFTAVGGTDGIVQTSYKFVDCPITTPITLHNKEGTSPYWFAMQVVNANEAVASLEVSTDGGSTWQTTTRKEYNFFENESGFGTNEVDVKITSKSGKTVTVSGVSIEANSQAKAGKNF